MRDALVRTGRTEGRRRRWGCGRPDRRDPQRPAHTACLVSWLSLDAAAATLLFWRSTYAKSFIYGSSANSCSEVTLLEVYKQ